MSAWSPWHGGPIYNTRSLNAHSGDPLQPLTCEYISGAEVCRIARNSSGRIFFSSSLVIQESATEIILGFSIEISLK